MKKKFKVHRRIHIWTTFLLFEEIATSAMTDHCSMHDKHEYMVRKLLLKKPAKIATENRSVAKKVVFSSATNFLEIYLFQTGK